MPVPVPALFIADAPGLDFLNSVATPIDTPVDWLGDGEGLLGWLEQSRWVSDDVLASIRIRAIPGEIDRLAAQARSLREWFRAFVQKHKGRSLRATDLAELEPLNELLRRDDGFSEIIAGAHDAPAPFRLHATRRWASPETLLIPIAQSLAQLVCAEDFAYVKACEGASCTLLFADHTRGHARRWCSMSLCGNRAKQAAHRRRQKAELPHGH
jgi:predicted RNA-binding Zn ribbon-like protein